MVDGSAVVPQETNMDSNKIGFWEKLKLWVVNFGGKGVAIEEETLRVEQDFILQVLPHRGRWRLLDWVVINPEKVIGFFTMTHEVCEGHAIGDNAVFPGALLAEMANQLLGVWYATQHPELIGTGKVLFARRGDYKASGFIRPGELVQIEANYVDLSGSMKTTKRGTLIELIGKNFLVKVGEELKGSVSLIELKGLEPPKISSKI